MNHINPNPIYRHVISVDMVGLSKPILSTEQQTKKIEILNLLVTQCEAFKNSQNRNIFLKPTGDGFIAGISEDPTFPIELAIQLQEKLKQFNKSQDKAYQIKIRIGIHSGPSLQIQGTMNDEWGEAFIGATRVMSVGSEDHILLSSKTASELIQLSEKYEKILHPLSDYQVKHEQIYSIYSAYGQDFGNPDLPSKASVIKSNKVQSLVKNKPILISVLTGLGILVIIISLLGLSNLQCGVEDQGMTYKNCPLGFQISKPSADWNFMDNRDMSEEQIERMKASKYYLGEVTVRSGTDDAVIVFVWDDRETYFVQPSNVLYNRVDDLKKIWGNDTSHNIVFNDDSATLYLKANTENVQKDRWHLYYTMKVERHNDKVYEVIAFTISKEIISENAATIDKIYNSFSYLE